MGPKCYAVQCIVNREENPQNYPFPWDFVIVPEKDWATAIEPRPQATCIEKLVKITSVVPEISLRTTNRQTHRHTRTDVLITILHHQSRGRSNKQTVSKKVERVVHYVYKHTCNYITNLSEVKSHTSPLANVTNYVNSYHKLNMHC